MVTCFRKVKRIHQQISLKKISAEGKGGKKPKEKPGRLLGSNKSFRQEGRTLGEDRKGGVAQEKGRE